MFEQDTVDFITQVGTTTQYGARELNRVVGRYVLNPIADEYIDGA